MSNVWGPGRSRFKPQGYNLNNLGRAPLDKAVYQMSQLSGFRQEDFLNVFLGPRGGAHFWPHGYNLKNLGRGPIDEAKLQISNVSAFWF